MSDHNLSKIHYVLLPVACLSFLLHVIVVINSDVLGNRPASKTMVSDVKRTLTGCDLALNYLNEMDDYYLSTNDLKRSLDIALEGCYKNVSLLMH